MCIAIEIDGTKVAAFAEMMKKMDVDEESHLSKPEIIEGQVGPLIIHRNGRWTATAEIADEVFDVFIDEGGNLTSQFSHKLTDEVS